MKKLSWCVFFVFIFGIASAVSIKQGIPTALNSSTYTEIINTGPSCEGFILWIDDATGFTYAVDSSGTGAVTVPDAVVGISFPNRVGAGDTVVWAKSTTGTPNLVFQPGK